MKYYGMELTTPDNVMKPFVLNEQVPFILLKKEQFLSTRLFA
ncbi:hypothetical protein [Candidatus Enterovibrio altilux]|uniref:Uncharacterized protein n=1 Tax=Candidatus Enterovibrio altilux TaxID=1927128 RepID=A0A291B7G7_9GAMM|nr:hypothetical protein [Candidatus Enterovibrio luxaltus]ATF08945.1 hypothetical protein BTN50_0414 [Candidatus Enterovibrio luxaltus]